MSQQYVLPDLLCDWPWIRYLSPFYIKAKEDSSSWVESLHPFSRRGQKAFNACDLNLLASLTYSNRDKDFVRVGCDLMNFFFVYDEYTDVADPDAANKLADFVVEEMKYTLESGPAPISGPEHVLGEMTKGLWQRAQALSDPDAPCLQRFTESMKVYLRGVTEEASDRSNQRIRSVQEYLNLRRQTCGGRPTLDLIAFGLNLPEHVINHPVLESLLDSGIDLIICVNDMHSYVREFSCGFSEHNIVTPIMRDHGLNLQGALGWLDAYTSSIINKFLLDLQRIPSWGPKIDADVKTYIDGIGQWVRGNDDWSCESKRYYGDGGLKVRETRIVSLDRKADIFLEMVDVDEDSEDCIL